MISYYVIYLFCNSQFSTHSVSTLTPQNAHKFTHFFLYSAYKISVFLKKLKKFISLPTMEDKYINIHTHKPNEGQIEIKIIGIHPWRAEDQNILDIDFSENDVQAIGEIGLDYHVAVDRTSQLKLFRHQLDIAEQRSLPVVIHCVKAFEAVVLELRKHNLKAVIFHGFMGSQEQMLEATKRGYYISFGKSTLLAKKRIETLKLTPNNFIFLETDCSDITIEEIYDEVAKIKNITVCELKLIIANNYRQIFG